MGRIEHLIAAQKLEKKDPSETEQTPPQKKGYFSKRTSEDIEQDRLELIEREKIKQAKHDFEQEQENERKRQHQPSRFEEDVSKIKNRVSARFSTATKRIAMGANQTLNVAAPAVKKVVARTVKTVAPIVNQMGKRMAKIDKEEKTKPKSTLFRPPREEKTPRRLMKMSEGADDYFASGLSKKMPSEKTTKKKQTSRRDDSEFSMSPRHKKISQKPPQKKTMKQPEGADEYFVGSQKKTPPHQEKKGKDRRGFGLGF
jgi:hypothetical protein